MQQINFTQLIEQVQYLSLDEKQQLQFLIGKISTGSTVGMCSTEKFTVLTL